MGVGQLALLQGNCTGCTMCEYDKKNFQSHLPNTIHKTSQNIT